MASSVAGMGEDPKHPTHSHLIDFPEALAVLLSRLSEIKVVLGAAAAPGVDQVEQDLRRALAARERGDPVAAVDFVGRAMERLSALASASDPSEGAAMQAVAARFRQALARGTLGEVKETAEVMRVRSGSMVTPKKGR
jgi:hypothetical protein